MKLPRHAELWMPGYLRGRMRALRRHSAPKRVWLALTDHYEPFGGGVDVARALKRVAAWQDRWPRIAADAPRDADGKAPRFTFFYPQEDYHRETMDAIASMCHDGTADVEVHIHHKDDTAETFREKVSVFCRQLNDQHGLLRVHDGRLAFGFIHGNWALDNSYPDGRLCGVKGELQVLRDLGCYADFTMPSLPVETQGRIINQIYWTTGDPERPKGFDSGVEALPCAGRQGDLLMITGPVGLRFRGRLMPRVETGELAVYDMPTAARVERWLDLAPRVGDDIFIKLYGHSAREDNAAALLGSHSSPGGLQTLFTAVDAACRRRGLDLHWASAWEMFRALEKIVAPVASTELAEAAAR